MNNADVEALATAISAESTVTAPASPSASIPFFSYTPDRISNQTIIESTMLDTRWFTGFRRHLIGILLLLVTVFLWTASNFITSDLFADSTFSKPYLMSYINCMFFIPCFVFAIVKRMRRGNATVQTILGRKSSVSHLPRNSHENQESLKSSDEDNPMMDDQSLSSSFLAASQFTDLMVKEDVNERPMTFRETWKLSLQISLLWFGANYFICFSLAYTTVASATIIAATSGVWVLLFGALIGVEKFNFRKLIGVLASLLGIILISSVDFSGDTDKTRGSFPHKSRGEIATGGILALLSAILYGAYVIIMKRDMGDESRVDMPLFFGFIGVINLPTLLPGFVVLHFTGIEPFELPPTSVIWYMLALNALICLAADFAWAYSTLLTSPLVVTVGVNLIIPLSLVGQMILNGQTSSVLYWVGAAIVISSFVFISQESKKNEKVTDQLELRASDLLVRNDQEME